MKSEICYSKFRRSLPNVLAEKACTMLELYSIMEAMFPECVTVERTKSGEYKWKHDLRNAQQNLSLVHNIIHNRDNKWYLSTNEEALERIEISEVEEDLKKEDAEKLRKDLFYSLTKTDEEEDYHGKRYKRNSVNIARIKLLRGNKCQICGESILTKRGGHYVEGAHIDEKKIGGPEVPSNILILCPNHHKEFDKGRKSIKMRNEEKITFDLNGKTHTLNLTV